MVLRLPLLALVIAARTDAAVGVDAPVPLAELAIDLRGLDPGEGALQTLEERRLPAQSIQPPEAGQGLGLDPPDLLQLDGRLTGDPLLEVAAFFSVEAELCRVFTQRRRNLAHLRLERRAQSVERVQEQPRRLQVVPVADHGLTKDAPVPVELLVRVVAGLDDTRGDDLDQLLQP